MLFFKKNTTIFFILKTFLTTLEYVKHIWKRNLTYVKNTCKALKNNQIYLGTEKCNK
jgi:hypothetical protein